jgi:broad specificity polyphosphatase/5'/3'-nucleotidase SurE
LPPDAKTTFNHGFPSVQLTQTYKDDTNNFSFYYPSNYSLTKNASRTNSEAITLSNGTSMLTLFVNTPYPQNATTTVQGIMNGHFENGMLQTDGGYGFNSAQQALYRGHEITELFTDPNGHTYYWTFYVVGDEEDEAALDIIYSLKVF